MMRVFRFTKVLLAVTSILLALSALEIGIRFYLPNKVKPQSRESKDTVDIRDHVLVHRRSMVPGLFYELNPGTFTVSGGIISEINMLGMRDHEISMEKEEGTYRIAILGDSFTYGWGVELRDTYVKQLEAMLIDNAAPGIRFEVLNFGVSGYNIGQEVIVLKEKVIGFDPDLVVFGYVTNDILYPVSPLARYLMRQDPEFLKVAREAGRLHRLYSPASAEDVLPGWLVWSKLACIVW